MARTLSEAVTHETHPISPSHLILQLQPGANPDVRPPTGQLRVFARELGVGCGCNRRTHARTSAGAAACVARVVCIAARDTAPGYGSRRGCACSDDAAEAYVSQTAQRWHRFHPIPLPPRSAVRCRRVPHQPPVGGSGGVDGEGSACTFGGSVRRRRRVWCPIPENAPCPGPKRFCNRPPPSKLAAAPRTRSVWRARNDSAVVSGRSWTIL
ncbi:hypothetical protein B0H10DRAFT_2047801 [Mycena sp. CBHHK59/15]|nr:hypothetical protein B0H10DRAFT_2047801 [Mycena sp. CBHHK59/15]